MPSLLANSAFASLDLFSPRPSTPIMLNSPKRPSRSTIPISHPIPVIRKSADSYTSDESSCPSLTSFGERPSSEFEVQLESAAKITLAPAVVLNSPKTRKESARRSLQLGKEILINWTKPLRNFEPELDPAVRIFGESLQRNRRLQVNAKEPTTPTTPSIESEMSSPVTPAENDSWSLKGLGVSGVSALDTFSKEDSFVTPNSTRPKMHTSQSLGAVVTPMRLADFETLHQANPIHQAQTQRGTVGPSQPAKRIKRKAVPAFLLASPNLPPLDETALSSPAESILQTPSIDLDGMIPRQLAFLETSLRDRPTRITKDFYHNSRATMSVIEVSSFSGRSSRNISTPIIPPRGSSHRQEYTLTPALPLLSDSNSLGSSGSSIASVEAPITPASSQTKFYASPSKNAFMSVIDLTLGRSDKKASENNKAKKRMSAIYVPSRESVKPTTEDFNPSPNTKHKRMFSKFFGRKHSVQF